MNNVTISVAMATYNGEKYLSEQLTSINEQTKLPLELVVCDDGSSDNTLSILHEFKKKANFPVKIHENRVNLGYTENFFKAANLCTGDWIAFSDQDDIWKPEKIEVVNNNISDDSLLVIHSADLVDKDLNYLGDRCPNIKKNNKCRALKNKVWWTPAGFTQCFSSEILKKFPHSERPTDYNNSTTHQAHDQWVYFIANSFSNIIYIKDSLALYRRHDSTVTGQYQSNIIDRFKKVNNTSCDHYRFLSKVSHEYYLYISNLVSNHNNKKKFAKVYYNNLKESYALRANLYNNTSLFYRIKTIIKLVSEGRYVNFKTTGLGGKAFIKDIALLFKRK